MEFLAELGGFAAKTLLIVGSIIVILAFLFHSANRGKSRSHLDIEKLNNRFKSFRRHLQGHILSRKAYKAIMKQAKKEQKADSEPRTSRMFVLDFDGDIRASAVSSLREEITAVLAVSKPGDEVVLRLESGGGMVTSYGLAASQLARLKPHDVKLTVCVDKIAASGGYMMACVADRILCAPFAVVGSIGVIAQVPNFNRLLKKHDIDYKEITAGEFKRTVTILGEITEPGLEKFRSQIESTHRLFKSFVSKYRPNLDISQVATGEHWYGIEAVDLGLVDEVLTSDDYIFSKYETADIYKIRYHSRKKLADRLSESLGKATHNLVQKLWTDLDRSRFGS